MSPPLAILQKYWNYSEFRPLQEEIIQSVLDGHDTLALLPTGGGKSICYQVPALIGEGICLVVSPLIALMKDQVANLQARGVPALGIYSGQTRREIAQTLKNAASGHYKLLYVSPERLETALFREFLPALGVKLIAVDEAHCISQWGYDFRPSYLKIIALRKELPGVALLALTASATGDVQKDICTMLGFGDARIFRQSYERKNLSYSAFKVESKLSRLVEIVKKVPGTAIIYCKSRKRTVEIASLLQMHGKAVHAYHAGLTAPQRAKRQQDWMENKVDAIVCTNAFGMGIDKPDVRLVVHADMPDCPENYYQEAGRAGRDGKKAYAVLLYDERDVVALQALHKVRFPGIEEIRKVYSALVNFLQVPVAYGVEHTYNFRFDLLVRNFNLGATSSFYALKALESDGWIYFNERSYSPPTVEFTTEKVQLRTFIEAYPQYRDLTTALLRTYEGIFDYPAAISESVLCRLTRTGEDLVKKALTEMNALGVIRYKPLNDQPQIIFRENRPAVEDLTLNLTAHNKRKEQFILRAEKMVGYTATKACRSTYLNEYFGERTAPCGICDECLAKRSNAVTDEEFKSIAAMIREQLTAAPLSADNLIGKLPGVRKEKAWSVLAFLQAENKLTVTKSGLLQVTS
jgi:ATP-dependent DNA helicase RecQ